MTAIPSCVRVAATATTSAVGVALPDKSKVLIPIAVMAVPVLQVNANWTGTAAKSEFGVREITNDCELWAGMSTGVLTVPVTSLVAGLVVW